jgi:integrase/recombinase XerD
MEVVLAHPDTGTRNGRRNQYLMIHAYETGGRIEELLDMTLSDIIRNGKNIQIRLHGKGDKTRYIPFQEEAIPHLDAYLLEFHPDGKNDDFLFYTIHKGAHTQMAPRIVNSFLAKYADELHEANLSLDDKQSVSGVKV